MAASAAPPRWLAPALLSLGSFGFAAAWVLLAFAYNRQCSWMALLAACDAAVLVRLARAAPGWRRASLALGSTFATILLANWGIAAAQMGQVMGLLPWESMIRLGPSLAWTLAILANPPVDLWWLWMALVLAVVTAR